MDIICMGWEIKELFLVDGKLYYVVDKPIEVGDLVKIPSGGIRRILTYEDLHCIMVGTRVVEPIGMKINLSEDDKVTYELKETNL